MSESCAVPVRKIIKALPKYVPGARGSAGGQFFKLSSNENPYPPLPSVLAALADGALEINRYPDLTASELIHSLAEFLDEDPDRLVVGNGSVALLSHLMDAVLNPGDEVIFGWRSFEAYPIATQIAAGVPVLVPLTADARLDLPAMAAAVTERTRVVLVCTPNNPTGPSVHADELEEFLNSVSDDVLVVIDEAYVEFVRDEAAPDALAIARERANVIVLRTMSKAYGLAGLRVGYAVGHQKIIGAIRAVTTPFGVNGLAQVAAVQSLRAVDELLDRVEAIVQARSRLVAELADQGWELPDTQANFVWMPLGERTEQRAAEAAAAGIIVRPFSGEGIRVTIGEDEALDDFLKLTATWL